MVYTKEGLAEKLLEIYPEIKKHGLDLHLEFNDQKNAWIINLKRGGHELSTHLDKKDADECMNGIKCVYLGIQIGQFIQNFEEDEVKLQHR